MNKNYVVAYMSYFDNVLKIFFVKAESIKEAVLNTVEKDTENKEEVASYIPEDMEGITDYYSNGDANISVEEVPKNMMIDESSVSEETKC